MSSHDVHKHSTRNSLNQQRFSISILWIEFSRTTASRDLIIDELLDMDMGSFVRNVCRNSETFITATMHSLSQSPIIDTPVSQIPFSCTQSIVCKSHKMHVRDRSVVISNSICCNKVPETDYFNFRCRRGAERLGMAIGSRVHLESEALAKRSFYRNFLMHSFHLLVVLVIGPKIKDTQCGFKVCPQSFEIQLKTKLS